jgi:hypothetical protein
VVGIVESVDIPVDVNAPTPEGYLLATADGKAIPFGAARSHGDASLLHLSAPIAGITSPSSGGGYFLFAQDGGVFTFGTFFRGSLGDRHLNGPIVAMTIRNYSACKGTQC